MWTWTYTDKDMRADFQAIADAKESKAKWQAKLARGEKCDGLGVPIEKDIQAYDKTIESAKQRIISYVSQL